MGWIVKIWILSCFICYEAVYLRISLDSPSNEGRMRYWLRFLTDLILYDSEISYWPCIFWSVLWLWLTCIFSFLVFLKIIWDAFARWPASEVLSIAQSRKLPGSAGEQDHDLDIVVSPSPDTGTQIQQCLIACQMNKDKLQSIITLLLVDNCLCFAILQKIA